MWLLQSYLIVLKGWALWLQGYNSITLLATRISLLINRPLLNTIYSLPRTHQQYTMSYTRREPYNHPELLSKNRQLNRLLFISFSSKRSVNVSPHVLCLLRFFVLFETEVLGLQTFFSCMISFDSVWLRYLHQQRKSSGTRNLTVYQRPANKVNLTLLESNPSMAMMSDRSHLKLRRRCWCTSTVEQEGGLTLSVFPKATDTKNTVNLLPSSIWRTT